jgi:hypothetical protein
LTEVNADALKVVGVPASVLRTELEEYMEDPVTDLVPSSVVEPSFAVVPCSAVSETRLIAGPNHDWIEEPSDSAHERRRCAICHLKDSRLRDDRRKQPRSEPVAIDSPFEWRVKTPCVHDVPSEITYGELKAYLVANGITDEPCVFGSPGHWVVGFRVEAREIMMCPALDVHEDRLNRCWSVLCRWIKASGWNIRLYSAYDDVQKMARGESGWE